MKKLILIVTLLVAPMLVIPTIGCKTSQQRQAVNTLFTVGKSVDKVYAGYFDLVVAGKISTNTVPRVSAVYMNFQTMFKAGVEFVASNTNAAAPQFVLDAATSFTQTVEQAKKGTL